MKKYIIILVLVFNCSQSYSQVGVIIPIDSPTNYYQGLINGTYIKDIHNTYGNYLGTWQANVNGKIFTLYLEKVTKLLFATPNNDYHYEDIIIGKYIVTSVVTGEVLKNTTLRTNPNKADFSSAGPPKNSRFELMFTDHDLCLNSAQIVLYGNPVTNQLRFVDQKNDASWWELDCPYAQKSDIPYPFPASSFDLIRI